MINNNLKKNGRKIHKYQTFNIKKIRKINIIKIYKKSNLLIYHSL